MTQNNKTIKQIISCPICRRKFEIIREPYNYIKRGEIQPVSERIDCDCGNSFYLPYLSNSRVRQTRKITKK